MAEITTTIPAADPRPYELVVFGATGVTGKLCARHVATHLPTDLRWAISGRSEGKLRAIAEDLRALDPDRRQPAIEVCSLDATELGSLALKTRLLVACVGPYSLHGEPALRACAETGTAYIDTTGEIPWVARMLRKYDGAARESGAVLIPQCGFESAASDMLVQEAVGGVRAAFGTGAARVTGTVWESSAGVSGGTLASVFALFDVFSTAELLDMGRPFALSPTEHPAPKVAPASAAARLTGVRLDPDLGAQSVWPMGKCNEAIVQRTWGLLDAGRRYGARFTYEEGLSVAGAGRALAANVALTLGQALIALPPVRWLLRRLVTQPGQGPSEATDRRSFVELRAVAHADDDSGRRVMARLYWKGSIYKLTAVLMMEAAVALLREKTDAAEIGGGLLTPACLGKPYADRLRDAGVVLESKVL